MNLGVYTYCPEDVVFDIGGFICLGWDEIKIAFSPGFRVVKGIRGKHTRTPTMDTSAEATISVDQTSVTNDVLSKIHARDLVDGVGRIRLSIKDKSGNTIVSSDEAYITKYADVDFTGSISRRVWSIFCQTTDKAVVGGNHRPETDLFSAATGGLLRNSGGG